MSIRRTAFWSFTLPLLAIGCGGSDDPPAALNVLPTGMTQHSVTLYAATAPSPAASATSAATQDLLTGGLGKSGLQLGAAAANYADPLNPTAAELRQPQRTASISSAATR